jgi:peroxiredoxin
MPLRRWKAAAALVCLAAVCRPASTFAGDLDPKKYEPAAVRSLEEVVRAYKALPAYSDQGTMYLKSEINGKKSNESTDMRIAFSRQPDRLVMYSAATRFFCDETAATSVLDSSHAYIVNALPKGWRMTSKSIIEYPGAASMMGGISGLAPAIIFDLLTSDDAREALLADTDGLRLEKPPAGANPALKYLLIDQQQGPDILLFIDPADQHVVEMKLDLDPKQLFEGTPPGLTVRYATFGWVAGNISTKAGDPNVFAFKPPKDYKKVESWEAAIDMAGQFDPQMNQPAPVFSLDVLDGPERTKVLHPDDLKGKVLLIVFWASWSPPCFSQLAWVKKELLDRYRDRGVVMVSVNLDDDPKEVNGVRPKVVRILEEKSLTLDQPPFSYVALDPKNTVGQHVKLKNIPATCVVDREGIIRFFFSGYRTNGPEPTRDRFEKLLDADKPASNLRPKTPQ